MEKARTYNGNTKREKKLLFLKDRWLRMLQNIHLPSSSRYKTNKNKNQSYKNLNHLVGGQNLERTKCRTTSISEIRNSDY